MGLFARHLPKRLHRERFGGRETSRDCKVMLCEAFQHGGFTNGTISGPTSKDWVKLRVRIVRSVLYDIDLDDIHLGRAAFAGGKYLRVNVMETRHQTGKTISRRRIHAVIDAVWN